MAFVDTETVKKMAKDALKFTSDIIDRHGPRLTGTQACLDAANSINESLSSITNGNSRTEDFEVRPKAFLGFLRVLVVTYFLGVLFLWINLPLVAAICIGIGVIHSVLEYLLFLHVSDCLYPKAVGRNVIATLEPTDEVKNVMIYSGHHDSAHRFNFYEDKPELYQVREVAANVICWLAFVLCVVLSIRQFQRGIIVKVLPDTEICISAVILTILGYVVYQIWNFLNDEGCPGASDNMISVAMGVEVAKYFKENPLKHTRVVIASFDSEEAGLRGAHDFWKRHVNEYNKYNTYNLNADCIMYPDELKFLTTDINSTVKLDLGLATECKNIAAEMGIESQTCPLVVLAGGTDAGEAARAGIKATNILSIPFQVNERHQRFIYHTKWDVVDEIDPRSVEQCLAVVVKFTEKLDLSE